MDINYSTDVLDDDFHVTNGVSYTVERGRLKLMAFVELNFGLKINGLSVEDRGETIVLSVLTQGADAQPQLLQHRITATIKPITNDWQGTIQIVVKQPPAV